jgi:hypothetical protein
MSLSAGLASASFINLELRAPVNPVENGTVFDVQLWFVSDGPTTLEWTAADVNIMWNEVLTYTGHVENPALTFGSVTTVPPTAEVEDEIRWSGTSPLVGPPLPADPPPGTLVTTLQFQANFAPSELPKPVAFSVFQPASGPQTVVLNPDLENVTGQLGSIVVIVTGEADCNGNGVPDDLDIFGATSEDCNMNAIPDECDIAAGTSEDANSDGVPDECEPVGCPCIYDLDNSCFVDSSDLGLFAACWLCEENQPCPAGGDWDSENCAVMDWDDSGVIDAADLGLFAGAWLQDCADVDPSQYVGSWYCEGEIICPWPAAARAPGDDVHQSPASRPRTGPGVR